jgi:hypothetical protein
MNIMFAFFKLYCFTFIARTEVRRRRCLAFSRTTKADAVKTCTAT